MQSKEIVEGKEMPEKLLSALGDGSISISVPGTLWVLLGAFLVFIMVPSIGMLEAGLTRQKNVVHGLMKSLSAASVMMVIFLIIGFGLAFSPSTMAGIIGNPIHYLFGGDPQSAWPTIFTDGSATGGVPLYAYVLFQMMFATVTLALIGAGVSERIKFSAWLLYSLFFSLILYPLVAHLVWSPNGLFATLGTRTGWLDGMGVRDFAGGVVVHAQAGFAGLAITLALGASLKRRATLSSHAPFVKFKKSTVVPSGYEDLAAKEASEKYANNIPLAVIGTALLWFGWFGFNGGSSLEPNLQGVSAALATTVAAAAAGLVSMLMSKAVDGRYDAIMAISGVLGGLVMITPNAGYVDPGASLVLGVLAGVVTFGATKIMEKYLYQIDDPIGGFPVHGVNGVLGSMLVPVFARPDVSGLPVAGLLYGGGTDALVWLGIQTLGIAVVCTLVFFASYAFIKVSSAFVKVRAAFEEEAAGLDLVDHGVYKEEIPAKTVGTLAKESTA
ncbi:Rh family protein/ammonium transporter [Thermobaculum terrenum ATCC BAA-798]|uniref:Ammonium transporter n=2 Tax=Thermobaculum TaxID=262406 RepID=D1CCP7_THET1|nr:Rh family protein/ammonium transporter [Thermobaculum terrenum ATCC BAA-798]